MFIHEEQKLTVNAEARRAHVTTAPQLHSCFQERNDVAIFQQQLSVALPGIETTPSPTVTDQSLKDPCPRRCDIAIRHRLYASAASDGHGHPGTLPLTQDSPLLRQTHPWVAMGGGNRTLKHHSQRHTPHGPDPCPSPRAGVSPVPVTPGLGDPRERRAPGFVSASGGRRRPRAPARF